MMVKAGNLVHFNWSELHFVGEGNQNPEVFNSDHIASKALQELVLLYPGRIEKADSADAVS